MPLYEAFTEKYEILEKIGQGGMGAVYRVRHRLLDELRVIKVIRSPMEPTPELTERFLREARTASRLHHPNLALLHDFAVSEDGVAYVVLEHIDGLTLKEVLRRFGPAPVEVALEIARQSCRALEYLHSRRIVHRDISPANLMLARDAEGRPLVKLIDLGLAKSLEAGADGLTTAGVFLGKLRYAAPEQFGGEGIDERSDLYSLGVVLYELLTGRSPFKGHDAQSWMADHLFGAPLDFAESDPEGRVPEDLRTVVMCALARHPAERFAGAADFATALETIQARYPLVGDEMASLFEEEQPAAVEALPVTEAEPERLESDKIGIEEMEKAAAAPAAEETTDSLYLVPPLRGAERKQEDKEGLLWDAIDAPSAVPPGRAPYRKTSFLPVALPIGVMLVLAFLIFLKGQAWWNPQAAEAPAVPAIVPPKPPVAAAPVPRTPPDSDVDPHPRPLSHPHSQPPGEGRRRPEGEESSASSSSSSSSPLSRAGGARVGEGGQGGEGKTPRPAKPVRETPVRETPVHEAPVRIAEKRPEPSPIHSPDRSPVRREPPVARHATVARGPMHRGDMIQPGPGVSVPVPLDMPRFSYPSAARGVAGDVDVRLDLLVDERGRVIDAVVREGESAELGGPFGFNEVALAAARKVSFQPATRNNIPGKMWTEMIFAFTSPGR
jgi:serine/threonine-protein kinase